MIKKEVKPVLNEETGLIESTPNTKIHLSYDRPLKSRRIFSSILDFLIFALITLLLFVGTKAIVESTENYQKEYETYSSIQLASDIYTKYDDKIITVTSYYEKLTDMDTTSIKIKLKGHINNFIKYISENSSIIDVQQEYDNYRLEATYNDLALFEVVDGEIVEDTKGLFDSSTYIDEVYAPFIENKCVGYLTTSIPEFLNSQKIISYYLLFLEIPVSVILGAILTYYVPGLIFKRGRYSLARLIFRIGLVNQEYLNVSFKRYTLRFIIILFGEIILSFFTFAVPLLISGSIMCFSKKSQPFHDKILKIETVDTTSEKVYFDKVEIYTEKSSTSTHVDFNLK